MSEEELEEADRKLKESAIESGTSASAAIKSIVRSSTNAFISSSSASACARFSSALA